MNYPNADYVIRPFQPEDVANCLRLFRSNLPGYFAPAEEAEFEDFLTTLGPDDHYFVMTCNGSMSACGGLSLSADRRAAILTWGMVDNAIHGSGLGKKLAAHRINMARTISSVTEVHLDTSQFTKSFYERIGFRLLSVEHNGYGVGFDKCAMVLKLD